MREAPGEPLLVVDGISGLGAMPFEMDRWGVDLVISAEPEGLDGVARDRDRGPRAPRRRRRRDGGMPRVYWDFAEAREWAGKGQTHGRRPSPSCTGSASASVGSARRAASGRGRATPPSRVPSPPASTLGLRLVAPLEDRSATVTAAWLPDGIDWAPFNADMRGRGLVVAGGQGKWTGKIFRFGHMGDVGIGEMVEALRIMGETLRRTGSRRTPRLPPAPQARPSRPRPHRLGDRGIPQRLVVVHGVTDWNREGRWQGRLDPPLSETGLAEASSWQGGSRTTRPCGRHGSRPRRWPARADRDDHRPGGRRRGRARVAPRRDRRRGVEGRTHEELAATDGERYHAWRTVAGYAPPGGEPIDDATERVRALLSDVAASARWLVLLVSHGGTP